MLHKADFLRTLFKNIVDSSFWEHFLKIFKILQVCYFIWILGHIIRHNAKVFHFFDFVWISYAYFRRSSQSEKRIGLPTDQASEADLNRRMASIQRPKDTAQISPASPPQNFGHELTETA